MGKKGKGRGEDRRREEKQRKREQFHQLEQVQHIWIGFYMDPRYTA